MRVSHHAALVAVLAVVGGWERMSQAQVQQDKTVGGLAITCEMGGLTGAYDDCGTDSLNYQMVFTGKILAIRELQDDRKDKEVTVAVSDVFLGTPGSVATVETVQYACGPRASVGDEWLFFVHSYPGKTPRVDTFTSGSGPISLVREQLELLKTLRGTHKEGFLRGQVLGAESSLAGATAIAEGDSSTTTHRTRVDKNGSFSFGYLPADHYNVSIDAPGQTAPYDQDVDLGVHQCRRVNLYSYPEAAVSGVIRLTDGKPAVGVGILLIDARGESYQTTDTDQDGQYEFTGVHAGDYLIGLNFPKSPKWFEGSGGGAGQVPPASSYYPNATTRQGALQLNVSKQEKLEHLDITLPAQ